jgi:hypothetical protein
VTASAYTWNEMTAKYLPHERELILALASGGHRKEAEFIHALKATFDGMLDERDEPSAMSQPQPDVVDAGAQGSGSRSSSVPTGHGSFAIPKGIQGKLASKGSARERRA